MKKLFFGMLAIVAMVATSCQQETDLGVNAGETAAVSFNVGTPTRAYSDGEKAVNLQYHVYTEDGVLLANLSGTATLEGGSANVKLDLSTGDTYNVFFWADAAGYYSVDPAAKTVTVDYANAVSNDENRDAFYAYHKIENVQAGQVENVELKRPFAQLNIGTNDYDKMVNAGREIKYVQVATTAYQTFLFAENEVANEVEVTYAYATLPENETFPVADYKYMAMNYLLVGSTKSLVEVKVDFSTNADGSNYNNQLTVGSVPVQRNYRTNIYGSLLTNNVDVNVEIKPGYDDAFNNEHGYYIEGGITYITSAEGLNLFAEKANAGDTEWLNATIVLANDIDLAATRSTVNWTPIGLSTDLAHGKTFRGTFNGNGYTIKNMVCEQIDYAGLFGCIYAATIKNVTIENATIKSNHYAGGIVSWVLNNRGNIQVPVVIENCHVKNSTITSTPIEINGEWDNGDKVGGLAGYVFFGDANSAPIAGAKIANCSVEGTTVKAYRDFGGLVGYASYVNLENCSTNNVTIEQDLSHDYKAPNTPTTYSYTIGRNEGGNTVNGKPYLTDGVTTDENGNYYIYNAAGLKWVSKQVNTMEFYVSSSANIFDNKTVYLAADIDLEGAEWTPIGDYAFSRTSFNGVFDGQNYTISNFKVTNKVAWTEKVTEASYGLFGNVKGTIKNVKVKNATVNPEGGRYTAALVGRLHNGGVIENCHVEESSVTIWHWQVGGIVGQNNNGSIANCSVVNSTITGKAAVGAIVGMDMTAGEHTIANCRVANTALVQNESFGASYDASYGIAVGLVNAAGITLHLNDVVAENNTIKGVAANTLIGDSVVGAKVYINGALPVATTEELVAAIKAGGNYILVNDIAMTEAIYQNIDFTLDGNGHTISQAEGSTNTYALFDSVTGKITLKNVTFAGIKGGAVLRTIGAEATIENVTIEGAETTQQQGLLRLVGKNVVKNSTFKNNTCSMVMTLNFDGANNDPQLIENCVFEGNTCNGTAAVYYVKGAGATINGNSFIGNTVNCNSNGATVYMGFQENCVVKNNLFKNNTVNEASTSSRVAGGIFFGYEMEFTGNAFIGNQVTGTNAKAKDVCVSTYYTNIDLSGNYWGGNAPVEDENYFVQHKDRGYNVIINDYLTTYGE